MADLAIMLGGYVSVPLFQNQASDTTRYVLQHAEVQLAFVGKLDEPGFLSLRVTSGKASAPVAVTSSRSWPAPCATSTWRCLQAAWWA